MAEADAQRIAAAVDSAWTSVFGDTEQVRTLTFWDLGGASLTAANLAFDLGSRLALDAELIEELFMTLFNGPALREYTDAVIGIVLAAA